MRTQLRTLLPVVTSGGAAAAPAVQVFGWGRAASGRIGIADAAQAVRTPSRIDKLSKLGVTAIGVGW